MLSSTRRPRHIRMAFGKYSGYTIQGNVVAMHMESTDTLKYPIIHNTYISRDLPIATVFTYLYNPMLL